MEEKKNANQPPEIKDEKLDKVTGGDGYTHEPLHRCSKCGREREWQGGKLVCPQCGN